MELWINDGLHEAAEDIRSFLLVGQSNMAGRGDLTAANALTAPDCFMLRMGRWQPMSEPINVDRSVAEGAVPRSGANLAASFAAQLQKETGAKIGLIPCADGGTRISQWQPGEVLFDHAVFQAKLAQRTSLLTAILWHQGESDCLAPEQLEAYPEQFLRTMEGFGDKSVANLTRAIEKARDVEAHRLLFALNIPLVGKDVCTRLLSAYSFDDLISKAHLSDDAACFASISGIGPEKSQKFVEWMHNPGYWNALTALLPELNVTQASTAPTGKLCDGLTFVITGDVHHYKNRNELKAYIESQGGKVTGSVSKSTSFLINNDVNSTSGKNQKARQLGIPVISEDDFLARYTAQSEA